MKHTAAKVFRLLLPAALLCAMLSVSAAASSALGTFTDVRQYQAGQFSDVAGGAWYESSVKTVYQKGIMEGASGRFLPDKPITWAEAAAITARLHAAYQGKEIPEADGVWYRRYIEYDRANALLPASCPDESSVGTAQIAREDLCLLMRSVLSEEDLPVINDLPVPDLKTASADAQSAVRDMYAAGVFTGKTGGMFQPRAFATRAEIATVVARLLCPAQRVGADSRIDQAMKDQYGNFLAGRDGSMVVSAGDTSYYLVEDISRQGKDFIKTSSIVARTDSGKLSTLYTAASGSALKKIAVGDDGMVYFVEYGFEENGTAALRRIARSGGQAETLYTASGSANGIETYVRYDGSIYILEADRRGDSSSNYKYRIGRLEDKTLKPLTEDMSFGEALYTKESLYCFGGKLYYLYGDSSYTDKGYTFHHYSLWSIDLASGKQERVIDGADKSIYLADSACTGATLWCLSSSGNSYDTLMRVNLLLPELRETVAKLPKDAMKNYTKMYANGSDLYYQSSGGQHLWKVSSSGEFTDLLRLSTPYIEETSVGKQAIIEGAAYYTDVLAHPKGGKQCDYYAFLGKPYLVKGNSGLTPAGKVQPREEGEDYDEGFSVRFTRTFFTARGDLAVEMRVVNGASSEINLRAVSVEVVTDKATITPYRFTSKLAKGEDRLYTLVIPVESLQGSREVRELSAVFYGSK